MLCITWSSSGAIANLLSQYNRNIWIHRGRTLDINFKYEVFGSGHYFKMDLGYCKENCNNSIIVLPFILYKFVLFICYLLIC